MMTIYDLPIKLRTMYLQENQKNVVIISQTINTFANRKSSGAV